MNLRGNYYKKTVKTAALERYNLKKACYLAVLKPVDYYQIKQYNNIGCSDVICESNLLVFISQK